MSVSSARAQMEAGGRADVRRGQAQPDGRARAEGNRPPPQHGGDVEGVPAVGHGCAAVAVTLSHVRSLILKKLRNQMLSATKTDEKLKAGLIDGELTHASLMQGTSNVTMKPLMPGSGQ